MFILRKHREHKVNTLRTYAHTLYRDFPAVHNKICDPNVYFYFDCLNNKKKTVPVFSTIYKRFIKNKFNSREEHERQNYDCDYHGIVVIMGRVWYRTQRELRIQIVIETSLKYILCILVYLCFQICSNVLIVAAN